MTTVLDSGAPRNDYDQVAQTRPEVDGWVRYLAHAGDWRRLTQGELQRCWASGKKMAVVHEVNRGEQLHLGYDVGYRHGLDIKPELDAMNWPLWRPCYCASDVDEDPRNYWSCLQYVLGHSHATGRLPGVYGESGLAAFCEGSGVFFSWLTNASSWSQTPSPNSELQQHWNPRPLTHDTDENTVRQLDWGGYHPAMPSFESWISMPAATPEEVTKIVQQEFVNFEARYQAAVVPKLDAILVNVDAVGVAAGKPGQGPDFLSKKVDRIAEKVGA